jgi:hypothetical protein
MSWVVILAVLSTLNLMLAGFYIRGQKQIIQWHREQTSRMIQNWAKQDVAYRNTISTLLAKIEEAKLGRTSSTHKEERSPSATNYYCNLCSSRHSEPGISHQERFCGKHGPMRRVFRIG